MDIRSEFVMAKATGCPYWPGRVCPPRAGDAPQPTQTSKFIFFFGTRNCYWVEQNQIKPYVANTVKVHKRMKPSLKKAIKEFQDYLRDPTTFWENAERLSNAENEDMDTTETNDENIDESPITFGFLGLDFAGSKIVRNLSKSHHDLIIWDQDVSKLESLKTCAEVASMPFEVLQRADNIFSCLSKSSSVKQLAQHFNGKGYIQICSLDNDVLEEIVDAIESNGGRYLEALLLGSQVEANDGNLIILAAGDKVLFDECQSVFRAIGYRAYFVGDAGNAMKMYLIMQSMAGITLIGLSESLNLAQKLGLRQEHVMAVLEGSSISSPYILEKGEAMVERNFTPNEPLHHLQRDLQLGLSLSHLVDVRMLMLASANECFKKAKNNGHSKKDVSAIYEEIINN